MSSRVVALVGNPNTGKTTVFNSLTGGQQKIGNWYGVTVEKKRGWFWEDNTSIEVIDLPGCYHCFATIDTALDEKITANYLASKEADLIVNIVDATNLERHLYLTLQLLERGFPVIVALNMMDAAHKQNIDINMEALATWLGCPVVPLVAIKEEGILELKKAIFHYRKETSHTSCSNNTALSAIQDEVLLAKARYDLIQTILKASVTHGLLPKINWTERLDNIVLNRFLGIPLFLGLMYGLFLFAIQGGGIFQDFFDITSRAIFVHGIETGLTFLQAPEWLVQFMALGVGQGINTTLSFVPVLAAMFLSLSFLEASGYMARAAFVMDKVMQWVGLPGKSFVPMIIGFGCNVPAVMAARTLENYRERILTILMTPFMSCGARFAIYALFVAAFFPSGGQNIIFGLYLIGIIIAFLTGFILRTTVLPGERSYLIIELPPYRWPSLKAIGKTTWWKLKHFILKAGTLVVMLSILLSSIGIIQQKMHTHNWLASMGRHLTPLFKPMGIEEENWPATVGLLAGILAKEVVVGTLNTLYVQEEYLTTAVSNTGLSITADLQAAWQSIGNNWADLRKAFAHPFHNMKLLESSPRTETSVGIMAQHFQSNAAAFAYLLFVLLYFPCISVVAAMAKELNRAWAIFSVVWTTGIAYIVAVLFYQGTMLIKTPAISMAWIMGLSSLLGLGFYSVRRFMQRKLLLQKKRMLPTPILVQNI